MSFIDNVSPEWLEAQYLLWEQSPEQMTPEWRAFFEGISVGMEMPSGKECMEPELARKQSGVQSLIHRYRDIGHLLACTDPLSPCKTSHPLLDLQVFGLEESDLDRVFRIRRFMKGEATLREILEVMRETYCRSIGVEFMHIQEPREREWLIDRMEPVRNRPQFSMEKRLTILEKLQETTLFEAFLNKKFLGQTRFSLEGGETLIPMLEELVSRAAHHGITDIILGMSHRGRLNVQTNIFGKPYEYIFSEFRDNAELGFVGDGDVKYHSAYSADIGSRGDTRIHLSMARSKPSMIRWWKKAGQQIVAGLMARRIIPVLVHGDAAFSGQGIVAETLNMSQLEGYGTGGTLHIVLNNQIGFTTTPEEARSTRYATDIAKMLMAPIFHVHGENPEAAVHVIALALDYRQQFARDVVVELICYRRYGHNEGDEPYFTQPLMYEKIRNRLPVNRIYGDYLLAEGIEEKRISEMAEEITARLEIAYGKEYGGGERGFKGVWEGFQREYSPSKIETGVAPDLLRTITNLLAKVPATFTPHPKIAALLQKRRDALANGTNIDWANAETLAFASLLKEGVSVRLSGQDSKRGTFNQRHCVIVDMHTEQPYVPLNSLGEGAAVFYPYDSLLSEAGVLGFEYGYSTGSPDMLTIWEAQYGDFANGAQVIDQFIPAANKWGRETLLLPHGFEGRAPNTPALD
jgi:2-oxoglutarate dehydrogenase E1 component